MKSMRLSATLFPLLMGTDVLITLWALQDGLANEGNPLGQLYYTVGPWLMVAVKLAAVVIILAVCYVLRDYKAARGWIRGANIVMLGICVHNAFTILPHFTGG
jgi:Domain of unknown function (DUF5658)